MTTTQPAMKLESTAAADPAPRPLHVIAREIRATWRNKLGVPAVNYAARPYLDAMRDLDGIDGAYYCDSAREIVGRFLANAGSWRGDDARRIKAELREMLK